MSDNPGNDDLKQAALDYHSLEPKGKIRVTATKPMVTQRDLALAYSPGVAFACEAIAADPRMASEYTARGNLVAVITNGTAVLGLGDIGPLAGKPVMEGKGVLFQKFAGIDVFDIELNERDPDKLVDIIAAMEPTFGGINLEDIKAPECFIVERKLRERMNIPVFHDDQLVGVALVELDVEHVDAGELLEQHALAFHHRLAGERTDVAQSQDRRAIRDHRHQVAARGVLAGHPRVRGDRLAGERHARRIRKGQVALGHHRLGRRDLDLALRFQRVIVERGPLQVIFLQVVVAGGIGHRMQPP